MLAIVICTNKKKRLQGKLTTSSPSITVPPAIVETSPNGSSLGSRSAFRRAMYRSSPILGSEKDNEYRRHTWTRRKLTFSCVCRHVDGGISFADNIVMCQGGRFAGHLDIVAYIDQVIFQ